MFTTNISIQHSLTWRGGAEEMRPGAEEDLDKRAFSMLSGSTLISPSASMPNTPFRCNALKIIWNWGGPGLRSKWKPLPNGRRPTTGWKFLEKMLC